MKRTFLETPNIPLARAFNTWAADRYVEMTFRPLGLRLTPLAFSAKAGKAVLFGPGDDVTLGAHDVDGSRVEATLRHAGTALDWWWRKASPFALSGGWRTRAHGEWGLRFWVCLCVRIDTGEAVRWDGENRVALVTHGPRTAAIVFDRAPLLVTGHADVAALAQEYEMLGYWHLDSRVDEAPLLGLRFNLEEAAENRFALSIADRADLAIAGARSALAGASPPAAEAGGAVEAVRDVMGWNGVWDEVNHRPYITCSRNWDLKKFGGFGFWLNDTAVNALLVSMFDTGQAREQIATLLSGATPQGNLPCILTGNDQWVDRTQSPVVSFIVWQLHQRAPDRALIEAAYPLLKANNDWLFSARDGNRNGLLEFGSSAVGYGLYVGTKLAAKDESFMDNSPVHDEARWVEESRTLDCEDVGLNCLACLDAEMLAMMARELGRHGEAAALADRAERLRRLISTELWDGTRNIFANRLWSGAFVRSLAPTSFYPLLCGAASPEQTRRLLSHLDDPTMFGGAFGLPSVARSDPAFADNVYWRGRIWPILNFLVWSGLRRAGETEAAARLAARGEALFFASWNDRRLCPENYNPVTGEGLDQADTDPFYSWSALLPWIVAAEAMHFSAFDGWRLNPAGPDIAFPPTNTPAGPLGVERKAGTLRLSRDGLAVLETDAVLSRLTLSRELVAATVAPGPAGRAVRAAAGGSRLIACHLGDSAHAATVANGYAAVTLPETSAPQRLSLVFSP
jgi:putative isomerase